MAHCLFVAQITNAAAAPVVQPKTLVETKITIGGYNSDLKILYDDETAFKTYGPDLSIEVTPEGAKITKTSTPRRVIVGNTNLINGKSKTIPINLADPGNSGTFRIGQCHFKVMFEPDPAAVPAGAPAAGAAAPAAVPAAGAAAPAAVPAAGAAAPAAVPAAGAAAPPGPGPVVVPPGYVIIDQTEESKAEAFDYWDYKRGAGEAVVPPDAPTPFFTLCILPPPTDEVTKLLIPYADDEDDNLDNIEIKYPPADRAFNIGSSRNTGGENLSLVIELWKKPNGEAIRPFSLYATEIHPEEVVPGFETRIPIAFSPKQGVMYNGTFLTGRPLENKKFLAVPDDIITVSNFVTVGGVRYVFRYTLLVSRDGIPVLKRRKTEAEGGDGADGDDDDADGNGSTESEEEDMEEDKGGCINTLEFGLGDESYIATYQEV